MNPFGSRASVGCVLVALLSTAGGCGPDAPPPVAPPVAPPAPPPPPPPAPPTESQRFAPLRDQWLAEQLAESPAWARRLGRREADGKVADYTRAGLAAREGARVRWLATFAGIDGAKLGSDEALDLAMIRHAIEESGFWTNDVGQYQTRPISYSELFDVSDYTDRPYAPKEVRLAKLVEHEEAALKQVAVVRANLVLPLSLPIAEVAKRQFAGYAVYLRGTVTETFAKIGDPALMARFHAANTALASEAEAVVKWFDKEVIPHADQSHVLGKDRYVKLLAAQEGLTTPIAELKAMNEENLRQNRNVYDELTARGVKLLRPLAKNYLAEATFDVASAKAFVVRHGIVTLPMTDEAVVRETPPYERWNGASIEMSGPFDPTKTAFFNVTLPDPKLSPHDQVEYLSPHAVLRVTAVHEVYPGHFVQLRYGDRAPTDIQKVLWSYSFVEGWAHYTEQMMLDEGYEDTPENRLGQVSDALLRNCRFKASIGIHTEGMTVAQATDLFANECKQSRPTAKEQAIRGSFDPGYFAYTLGKLEILKLRDEVKAKLGPKFSLRAFHDALLSHGSAPVPLLRPRVLADLGAVQ